MAVVMSMLQLARLEASLAPVGITNRPLVPGEKPGLKEGPFSHGFVLPVGKLGPKGFPNREYSLFLY